MAGVLDGVKVVELASWTFVPAAGVALAEWGAQVIKVEDVKTGDPGRALVVTGLRRQDAAFDRDYLLEIGNRGKRSIGLDLRSAEGRAAFNKLIENADVFLTNWLPGPRRRLGIDVDDLRAINPKLIYARGTGQGSLGAEADQGGFDAASYMSRGGVSFALTTPGSAPIGQTAAFGDLPSGMTLAGGVAAALYRRATTGEPSVVDVSLLSQAIWTMSPEIMAAEFFGIERTGLPDLAKSVNPVAYRYRTKNDRWIQVTFLQPDRFWPGFVTRIGRPELAQDPRFTPLSQLIANRDLAVAELQHTFEQHDHTYWLDVLADEPGVWALVASPKEVLDDPQTVANGYFTTNVDSQGRTYRMVTGPVQFDEASIGASTPAPEHGQQTEEILLELGMDWPEIIAGKESGAFL